MGLYNFTHATLELCIFYIPYNLTEAHPKPRGNFVWVICKKLNPYNSIPTSHHPPQNKETSVTSLARCVAMVSFRYTKLTFFYSCEDKGNVSRREHNVSILALVPALSCLLTLSLSSSCVIFQRFLTIKISYIPNSMAHCQLWWFVEVAARGQIPQHEVFHLAFKKLSTVLTSGACWAPQWYTSWMGVL